MDTANYGAWKDICSAPRDGTKFIAWDGERAYKTSLGSHYVLFPHQDGGPTFSHKWQGEDHSSIFFWNPTHWIEIPEVEK